MIGSQKSVLPIRSPYHTRIRDNSQPRLGETGGGAMMGPVGTDIVTLQVNLPGRGYAVDIGVGLLKTLGPRLRRLSDARRAFLVTDANVGPLYGDEGVVSLRSAGFQVTTVTVPPGDASKSLEQAGLIYDRLAERTHGRREPIVALGGGAVGDLAGFVAATWMRGVPFVQCPTTLEADIDASVGGKTAVNHPAGKNLIGAFHQPVLVWIDIAALQTLSDRDFKAGLAESVKHAVIRDEAFLAWHEENAERILRQDPAALPTLIHRNCRIKASIVEADEREFSAHGVGRAALNLGHTIGHAIESQSGYGFRHGEAVALGMNAALDLAVRECGFPEHDRRRVESLLSALGLPIRSPCALDADDLVTRTLLDKKALDRLARFVLPVEIGRMRWLTPTTSSVRQAIARIQAD